MNKKDAPQTLADALIPNDAKITELFFTRDERALDETSRKYGRLFFSIAHGILESEQDAEECVNDAYMKLWSSIPPERPSSFAAYGGRIVRNLSINRAEYNRAARRGGGAILTELDESVPDSAPSSEESEGEISRLIDAFLRLCDRENRVMFVLRYWYCMPLEEIARKVGKPVSFVKTRLFRTRAKLRGYLEKEGVSL